MNDSPWNCDYAVGASGSVALGAHTGADFEIGDIVSLIVGGPDMVVISTCECGTVEVAWAKMDGDVMVDVFPEEALVHVE